MAHNFITNSDKGVNLKKRLTTLMSSSEELKFLVGFFYFSGWQEIFLSLKENEDISLKILVGLQVDKYLSSLVEYAPAEDGLNVNREEQFSRFMQSLGKAINNADMDNEQFYTQLDFFVQMLQNGRLIIRKTLNPNHAKLYLFKWNETLSKTLNKKGEFITGSSNLTRAGLHGQEEFNVEISDYGYENAEAYFDDLWETAIPITEAENGKKIIVDFLRNKSIGTEISPFEAYVQVLKTIVEVQEQRHLDSNVDYLLEQNGFERYNYQIDAVNQALQILEEYNGVIVADVVGLGKSVIASLIASQIKKRGLILCPPGLVGNKRDNTGWWEYVNRFRLYDWDVDSSGNLENIAESLARHDQGYEVVIIDEAHRFRNQDTAAYEALMNICIGKKVILLTATPFNNSPADIFSMLKLFIVPGMSGITLEDDLEAKFARYNNEFKDLSYILKNWNSKKQENKSKAERLYTKLFDENPPIDLLKLKRRTKEIANDIKSTISPVIIRRNRIDLKKDYLYSQEISQLSDIDDPKEIFFELNEAQSEFYNRMISAYFTEDGHFSGAIYQPAQYDKEQKTERKLTEAENRSFMQQRNLFDFMRRLLVKRFESSFGAFEQSIARFLKVNKMVLAFIEKSGKYILDRKMIEDIYDEDGDGGFTEEAILDVLKKFEERATDRTLPKHTIIYDVNNFHLKEKFIADIKRDIKLFEAIRKEIKELNLIIDDPKRDATSKLIKEIISRKENPKRKVILFTEYLDTVNHLKHYFEERYPNKVLICDGAVTRSFAATLNSNFNTQAEDIKDDYQILITSDKLSEGFNLNRAGVIINYDIPWNPTRVIQRVGRINRMSAKVFDLLAIYNIFPTERGADIIKSRQIAEQKMYLIHNALGEDSKIFDIDEEPTASGLYAKINHNPESDEELSIETVIRNKYQEIKERYPDTISKLDNLPNRTKTGKSFTENNTVVIRKKGLALFYLVDKKENEKHNTEQIPIETLLSLIECNVDEKRLALDSDFWKSYEHLKTYKPKYRSSGTSIKSLEQKATTSLKDLLKNQTALLDQELLGFINVLLLDIRKYKSLSDYTLRRLTLTERKDKYEILVENIKDIRLRLKDDYLNKLRERISKLNDDVIIAIKNKRID